MTRSKSMFGRDLGDWETKQYSDMGATGKDRIDSTYDNGTAIYHLVAHDWIVSASEQHRVEDFTISAKAKRKTRFTSDTTDTDNADDATISSGAKEKLTKVDAFLKARGTHITPTGDMGWLDNDLADTFLIEKTNATLEAMHFKGSVFQITKAVQRNGKWVLFIPMGRTKEEVQKEFFDSWLTTNIMEMTGVNIMRPLLVMRTYERPADIDGWHFSILTQQNVTYFAICPSEFVDAQ